MTLRQTAKLPTSFWSYACRTATYLINKMPNPILNDKSPFETLLGMFQLTHTREIFVVLVSFF